MNKILAVILLLFSIASFAQRNKGKEEYYEDLSKVHPKYTANLDSILDDTSTANKSTFSAPNEENERLHIALDSIAQLNKEIKYIRGYKVLVFSGNSQEEALEVRKAILEIFEEDGNEFKDIPVEFKYHQPMFRIKVGEYKSRLEAVRMAEYLKQQEFDFGEESEITINPLVVPDNIDIKREKN